jgi:hypothetical protein
MNCNDCKNYKPKVIEACSTCKYTAYASAWEPCKSCARNTFAGESKWEPQQSKEPKAQTHCDFGNQPDKTATTITTTYRGKLYREVKRKANVGELVKIVNAYCAFGSYKEGDCLIIIDRDEVYAYVNGEQNHHKLIFDFEYVTLEPIAPIKRVYTAEQIQEARDIVYRIMTSQKSFLSAIRLYTYPPNSITYLDVKDAQNKSKPRTIAKLIFEHLSDCDWSEARRSIAFCHDNDEWNDEVGRMVAICKLTGEKLPKWVRGE